MTTIEVDLDGPSEAQDAPKPRRAQIATWQALLVGAAIFALGAAAVTWTQFKADAPPEPLPAEDPAPPPAVVQYYEDAERMIEIGPSTRLDLLMRTDGDPQQRCSDYGGTYDPAATICYEVDH